MSSIKTALSLLKTPGKMILPMGDKGLFNWLQDETYIKLVYRGEMGKKLDLDNPKSFNEKLQWLKLYDRNPLYHRLVDKYMVKQYISEVIGPEYSIPTIGVWDNVEKIPFEQLPNQFVIKCTHDSGSVIICKYKNEIDVGEVKKKLSSHMNKSTYWFGREWPYKELIPKVIVEPYLEDKEKKELWDYKVHCFNGVPKVVLVCRDRFLSSGVTEDFFDVQWHHLKVKRPGIENSKQDIPYPEQLGEILAISKKLSKDIPFVRVDFYLVNHHLYIGEMTFFPASGLKSFLPNSFDDKMGSWLKLPERGEK